VSVTATTPRLSLREFVPGMAMMQAMVAIAIDGMLPALPEIARDLTPGNPTYAQLVVTSFVLGMGIGTLFTGPLSDAFGRKPVMIGGGVLYIVAAVLIYLSPTLETVVASRFLMGLGSAGPRVVALAVIRDLYKGREMARIASFVMVVFALVPAIAPMLCAGIITLAGWRSVFFAFALFAAGVMTWYGVRQAETLALENRRAFRFGNTVHAVTEMFRHPSTRLAIFAQALSMGMLFSVLTTTQPIFDQSFGQGDNFPYWFALIAVIAATASALNARLVIRFGMRGLIRFVLTAQIGLSLFMIGAVQFDLPFIWQFATFFIWTTSVFFQTGFTVGNLNALALEPMGHIAGIGASVLTAFATVGAVVIAVPVGLAFDGTARPLAIGVLICAIAGRWIVGKIKRDGEA
jgi:DHA1 family bicyclomycin/chloramphenicol resistance-like MFS transporter